ncbi:hypothetical protein BFJ72_g3191 [Fusarium proliferatum]|uniref:Uncharacterized protein n=1 Tax=Gibberella intermedia TaxID=948311 RepID=A0A365NH02_GIBIN|nr:hypothetical protein FPRO05_08530 [Fusarium proliferatum]RKL45646.1 hypothetical protein BFJ72_g3191 [Fusarium proliferatum]
MVLDHNDLNEWKGRFNNILACPSEHNQTNAHNNGPVDHNDLNQWNDRFNDVLASPSEHDKIVRDQSI